MWSYGNMTLEHAREMLKDRVCSSCGKSFDVPFRSKYCSDSCYYKHKISRAYTIQYRYGISVSDYEEMLAGQGGACAICKKVPESETRLVVDHDHETTVVRGLLCSSCNLLVGHYESLRKEVDEYLSHPRQRDDCTQRGAWTMILRAVIYDQTETNHANPKHSFVWTEGEEAGVLIQHANMWIHPAYSLSMFMDVLHGLVRRRNDTIMVFYWTGVHWMDLD